MKYIITIDIGTMSMRAIVYDTTGKSYFSSCYEYSAIFTPPSLVEQDPEDWRKALLHTMTEAGNYVKTEGIEIAAISVTSQRASVIPVDQEGVPLYNAVTWQDKRSVEMSEMLTKQVSLKEIYQKTGLRANPYFSLPKMMWFKHKAPEIYQKTHKLIGVQDYVIFLLTGEFKTDWSQAARTMLMNIKTFEWDEEMLAISGIDRNMLCELVPPGSIAGEISKELSSIFGIQSDIPVIIAGGDQQNAAIALNVIRPGICEANTGTGSFVICYSDKPVFDEECRVLCSASAIPGKWIVEAGIFNTGAIYRWLRNQFYGGPDVEYGELNDEASKAPVGSNGVMLIPHFEGSAAPYWNPFSKGLFFNLSLGTTRADMTRAVVEGIAMEIAENISLIEAISGSIDTISVAGGMTRSNLFNDIQASAFGKDVICYPDSEASALGAAISAAVTLKVYDTHEQAFAQMVDQCARTYKPVQEDHQKYIDMRDRKRKLYNALNDENVYEEFMNVL